jgi:hypothetical protein
MNLQMIFQKELVPDRISYEIVFCKFCEWFAASNQNHNIEVLNWPDCPSHINQSFEDRLLAIRNKDNGKCIIISYWDRMFDLFLKYWKDFGQIVQIISSSGLWHFGRKEFKDLYAQTTHVPFSYLICHKYSEDLIEKIRIPFLEKKNNELFFRGRLYDFRGKLMNIDPSMISDKVSDQFEYFTELTRNKICLSLDGAGVICHRDIEILGLGSVLFRPDSTPDTIIKTHEQLLPDVHYVAFEKSNDPQEQIKLIKEKYNEIKDKNDFLAHVANNGLEWYKRNGTIESNIRILREIINVDVLL